MSQHPHLIGVWFHSRLKTLPIGRAHFRQADDLERSLRVTFAQQRLHLKQRITDVELDRRAWGRQSNVGKERTEPAFGLDDAFEMLVALGSGNVGGSPGKQRPPRRRPRQVAAPDLY